MKYLTSSEDRRVFLKRLCQWGAASAAAVIAPLPYMTRLDRRTTERHAMLAKKLTETLSEVESARVVGASYLRSAPAESSLSILLERIELSDDDQKLQRLGRDARRRELQAMIRRDFARGRIVSVDGWVLAQTEARLYALTAAASI